MTNEDNKKEEKKRTLLKETTRYFYFSDAPKQRKAHCQKCHGTIGLDGKCRNCKPED